MIEASPSTFSCDRVLNMNGGEMRRFTLRRTPHLVRMVALCSIFLPCLALVVPSQKETTLKDILYKYNNDKLLKNAPITNTVQWLPSEYASKDLVFLQKATNTRILGIDNLQKACHEWEKFFQTEEYNDVTTSLCRASMISSTTMIVQWNVTWTNPSVAFLEGLANWNDWTPQYQTYIHLSDQVSTFSYKAVAELFWEAITTKRLRIPLACIQGTSTLEFSSPGDNTEKVQLVSITEDLGLAQDLQQRNTLKNRKCAQDLRLFLETARRMSTDSNDQKMEWDDILATKLPWTSVPGMGALDIEESSDDPMVAVLFLAFSACVIGLFAAIVAPELIGYQAVHPEQFYTIE